MYNFLTNEEKYKKEGNILYEIDNGFTAIKTNFPVDGHDVYNGIEDKSFWFKHRIKCMEELIKKYVPAGSQIIDVGGGNGYNAKFMQEWGYNPIVIEPSLSGCKNSENRGVKNIILGLLREDNIKNSSLDNLSMFDVLECVSDDKELLKIVYNKLKKNGHLILCVPAFNALWSQEDVDIGNVRRFEKKNFEKMLKEIGFDIEYSNYLFQFLFLPIFFVRALKDKIFNKKYKCYEDKKKLINNQHNTSNNKVINKAVDILSNIEYKKIKNNKKVLFGSSIIIIAKK